MAANKLFAAKFMRSTIHILLLEALLLTLVAQASAQEAVPREGDADEKWWLRINELERQEREKQLRSFAPEEVLRSLIEQARERDRQREHQLRSWRRGIHKEQLERSMKWEEIQRRLRPQKPKSYHGPLAIA